MNFTRLGEMIRKEFTQLFRDKRVRHILILVPIVQIIVFGYVINFDLKYIRLAIHDQSKSRESRITKDAFTGNKIFKVVHENDWPIEHEKLLLKGKTDMVIKFPPNFSEKIRRGETAQVQILVDGSVSNMAATRVAYATAIIERLNQQFLKEIYPHELLFPNIDFRLRTWYNPNIYSRNFFVPGIVAFVVMLISLLFTSMAIIKEKEKGTMEQLIVTPIKAYEIIIGKTIPYIIISLLQMIFVALFAIYWFDLPMRGSIFALFLGVFLFLLSSIGIGLFISTISETQQQAMMTTFFFIQPSLLLSGFIFPIANMPIVVQWITYINPFRYILVIIRGVFLKGIGMDILWPQFLALGVLSTFFLTAATIRFKKRLD
ncbi:MAG: ABC transporter permease [Syntrophales bacterium]|nr:ABC transporter permease [Syntrophales bacterium]